ncbi:MAG: DUF975 family protein [Eubacteriales bacterium]|nr:DUF975 family protein [Eubacteriales bacterium]
MKRTSSELKGLAREALLGNYTVPVAAFFMTQLAIMAITFTYTNLFGIATSTFGLIIFYIGYLIIVLLSGLVGAGYSRLLMNLSRNYPYQFSDLIYPFSHQGDRILLTTLLKALMELLCLLPALAAFLLLMLSTGRVWLKLVTLILFLVGMVGCFAIELTYALTTYICLDTPELTTTEVMQCSREMMQGNRLRLLYVEISFIGLMLLSVLSLNIGFLWLYPYMETTKIQFYRDLSGEI